LQAGAFEIGTDEVGLIEAGADQAAQTGYRGPVALRHGRLACIQRRPAQTGTTEARSVEHALLELCLLEAALGGIHRGHPALREQRAPARSPPQQRRLEGTFDRLSVVPDTALEVGAVE